MIAAKLAEALEKAKNGLLWYRDRCPEAVDGSDDEAMAEIEEVLAEFEVWRKGAEALSEAASEVPHATMAPSRAAFFLRRFKTDAALLGPAERHAIDVALVALSVAYKAGLPSASPLEIERIDDLTQAHYGSSMPGAMFGVHRAYARTVEQACAEEWGVLLPARSGIATVEQCPPCADYDADACCPQCKVIPADQGGAA